MSEIQQFGPPTQIRTEVSNEALLERLEALSAEIAGLRAAGRSPTPSAVSASGLSAMFVPGATHERSEAASRSLNAVSSVALPEGGLWRGSQDTRSVKRFLDSVSQRVQASGLRPHGAFFYLINKCLSAGLAEELLGHCPSTKLAPVDYADACREASEYLVRTFHSTNLPSRFIERLESLVWAKECGHFDEFRQTFHRMMREAQLLEVQMTEDNKRRLFVKGLPEKMRDMVEERFLEEVSVERLIEMLDAWLSRRAENPFSVVTRKVVRGVGYESAADAMNAVGQGMGQSGGTPWVIKCFGCGEPGHIKANCPRRRQGRPTGQSAGERPAAAPIGQTERDSAGQQSEQISWKAAASLRVAGAAADRSSPRAQVTLTDVRGDGLALKQIALLDTGAEVTCCSKAFADRLFQAGIVREVDIRMGYKACLSTADDVTQVKPLGTVRVMLEGAAVEVVVVPARLCADLIVGYDQLTANANLFRLLMADMAGRVTTGIGSVVESPPRLEEPDRNRFASVVVQGSPADKVRVASQAAVRTAVVEESAAQMVVEPRTHCDWPPVSLKWKEGALEQLKPNLRQAKGEARQLESRMGRKSPELLKAYKDVLDAWIGNGWLEAVDEERVRFCLRHFGVEKDREGLSAMARCRVVVDGAALTPLLRVPSCSHTDTVKNLLLWRSADVFTVLDISQAYMRIKISDEDSFYLCIHWGGRFYRFKSLPMGIAPSAQILQEIVDTYIEEYLQQQLIAELALRVAPYMDDLVQCGWFKRAIAADDRLRLTDEMELKLKTFLAGKRMAVSEGGKLSSLSRQAPCWACDSHESGSRRVAS